MSFKLQFLLVFLGMIIGATTAIAQSLPVPTPRPNLASDSTQAAAPVLPKPERVYQSACPALLKKLVDGKPVPPIDDNGCGERSPIEVSAIAGVKLSRPATLNCKMTTALVDWVQRAQEAARETYGAEIGEILSSTSYHCRRRNNLATGKISEHGFANALDITGFRMENGTVISVLGDWQPAEALGGRFLRQVHGRACESFTTVLGPDADPYHTDHLHFDLGCHGKTCSYLICE